MFEQEKQQVDFALDVLAMKAYDAGWNSALDVLNEAINHKHLAGDRIAVEVLVWARDRLANFVEVEK
jgi:hypothetical protein